MSKDSNNTTPEENGTMSGRSKVKKYGIPASLLAGGLALGSAFAPVNLASAQDEDGTSDAPTEDSAEDRGGRHRHGRGGGHARHGAKMELVTELLDISAEDLKSALQDGQTLADVANEQGVSTEDLVAAMVDAASERLDQAVEDGKLTAEEAETKEADLEDKITERVTSEFEGRGDGEGRGRGARMGGAVFEELGIDRDALRAGFEADQTMVEIAAEAGVSEAELVAAFEEAATERLETAVENGKLSEEEAAEKLAELSDKVSERINTRPSERPGR